MKYSEYKNGAGRAVDDNVYRSFAQLAADWLWELDENLCYVFHDGRSNPALNLNGDEFVGCNRIDILNQKLPSSEELTQHHTLMQRRENVDLVLPVSIDGPVKFVHIIARALFDGSGKFKGYKGCGRDVSGRVERETKLSHLATHDDLTGVINRREFERKLGQLYQRTQENQSVYSLCFIDLDRFKQVNDTGGHHAGDQLLRELVVVIQKHVQADETVARLGGDEFGLLLRSNASDAANVVERIIDGIARYSFCWNGKVFNVGASVGIAEISSEAESIESLMIKADNACYAAKRNGRNQVHISDAVELVEFADLGRINMIRRGLESNSYKLLMQPIVSLNKTEDYTRYELLVRLACDNGELLEPAAFMPLANKYALMQELDCWVVENALHALVDLCANGEDVALSINLSASTLANADALNRLKVIVDRFQIPKQRVCFDITESYAIRNLNAVSSFMDALIAKGVEFALDDFGNGLCSFTYLQHLPITYLKIDGELIRNLATNETVRCIATSIHELSQRLGILTVAESVEDPAATAQVKAIGIDYMQGFGVAALIELKSPSVLNPSFSITR